MAKRGFQGAAGLAFLLALAACGGKDKDKSGREIDPAVANALEDQIMVDPNLVGPANRFGRTPQSDSQAPMPAPGSGGSSVAPGKLMRAPAPVSGNGTGSITLGERAEDQAARGNGPPESCDQNFKYGAGWAASLPAEFPLYPDAQVTEAAGNNDAPCRMRLVSFSSKAPLQTLIDFYYTQAIRHGFSAEHQLADGEHILAGARKKDGGAYYLTLNGRKDGGTDVDMIVNHGR